MPVDHSEARAHYEAEKRRYMEAQHAENVAKAEHMRQASLAPNIFSREGVLALAILAAIVAATFVLSCLNGA